MKRPELMDFGGWVQSIIDKSDDYTVSDLSREAGIPYPSLDRILKSGKKDKVVRPNEDTIDAISQALLKAGLIEDLNEAWAAAGFIVEGYRITKSSSLKATFPRPEDVEYQVDPDIQMIVEAYSGGTDRGKRAIKSAAELALEMSRENSIGKRAE